MAFSGNDLWALRYAVDHILDPVRLYNTLVLSKRDVDTLVTARDGICKVPAPFTLMWADPACVAKVGCEVQLEFEEIHASRDTPGDPEFVQKITSWVIRHHRAVYEKAVCRKAVDRLEAICKSPKQVRYLWPTITLLCKQSSNLDNLRKKVETFEDIRNAPRLTPQDRELLKEAAAILTMHSLVELPVGKWEGDYQIDCNQHFSFMAHGILIGGN